MSEQTVRVAFLDVGQGDTIVVSLPEYREAVVVDCIAANNVFEYLKQERISVVRALVITHLHADHYRQATAFLDNCERQTGARCERLIVNPIPEEEGALPPLPDDHSDSGIPTAVKLPMFEQLERWMLRNSLLVDSPHASTTLPIRGRLKQKIQFLHPFPAYLPRSRTLGFNNSSMVLRVAARGTSALLTGDLEPEGWNLLKRNTSIANLVKADVLKFPHHGAWKKPNGSPSDARRLLKDVGAKKVVISVGTEQKGYEHPDAHVFEAIRQLKLHLLCTQATKKCGGSMVHKSRGKTQFELDSQSRFSSRAPLLSTRGCPCAGSVVIDLDRSAEVLQPDSERHRKNIVRGVFARRHQCFADD